jgi:hypothetical protein
MGDVCVPATLSPLYAIADDRTDDCAFGAMMLLASGKSPKNDDF